MKDRRPASRIDVCLFMASLCHAAGQPNGRARYFAEMVDLVLSAVRA